MFDRILLDLLHSMVFMKENYSNKVQRSVNVVHVARIMLTKRAVWYWMKRILFHFFLFQLKSKTPHFGVVTCVCVCHLRLVLCMRYVEVFFFFISRQIFTNGNKRHHFQKKRKKNYNYLYCLNFVGFIYVFDFKSWRNRMKSTHESKAIDNDRDQKRETTQNKSL